MTKKIGIIPRAADRPKCRNKWCDHPVRGPGKMICEQCNASALTRKNQQTRDSAFRKKIAELAAAAENDFRAEFVRRVAAGDMNGPR